MLPARPSFTARRLASLALRRLLSTATAPLLESSIRDDLAAAHTLSHHYGFDELVWNHISARIPGEESGAFLVTPGHLHFDEVRPSNLVRSSAQNTNVTSDVIHSTVYKARPDVGAIVHHHTTAVVAVSAMAEGLQFLTQDSAAFYGRVAYHDWEGVSDDYDESARIAAKVAGGAHTVIMRNHGGLTFGETVGEAWVRHYYLDRVCRVQVAVGGNKLVEPDAAVLEHAASQYDPAGDGSFRHGKYEWDALRRQAERLRARHV
jgi:ribulose-5-phosphate 4-epimerase/fuculose-1-phosphate aldolase